MAANGSRGPRPYQQRHVATTFLRVPRHDWPAVKRGYKSQFRAGNAVPQLFSIQTPTVVVAYSVRNRRHDECLMVLEKLWQEPLGAISPESLEREGFASFERFRDDWMVREKRRFSPTRQVFVYRVRAFTPADIKPAAARLFAHLYGDFLGPESRHLLAEEVE